MKAVAQNQGFNVEFYREPFFDILPSIKTGKYQVAMSDITVTPERAAQFDHSTPYINNPTVIIHSPNTNINALTDLKPLRVGTVEGSFHAQLVKELAPTAHNNDKTPFQLIQGIAQNKYDAVLNEKYIAAYTLQNYPQLQVSTKELSLGSDQIAMFVQKGNGDLLNKLNAGIAHLKSTGELDKITTKYIQNR